MLFQKAGDIEVGHSHTFDHGTLIAHGSVEVQLLDESDNVVDKKTYIAPSFVFIQKLKKHRIIALEDNTVAACIHALRDIDEEILPPDILKEEKVCADRLEESDFVDDHLQLYMYKYHGYKLLPLTKT